MDKLNLFKAPEQLKPIDQFAKDYNEIYEFLVTLSDKADTIACNCDGDFDGEAWIYTQCHLHKAKELLEELEK